LARLLPGAGDPAAALGAYEAARLPPTSRIVLQNRSAPPNVIVDTVEQRTGGKRFDKLEDVISPDELKAIFERYQKVAGYHVQQWTHRVNPWRHHAFRSPWKGHDLSRRDGSKEMGVPQCISIVDSGGHLLAFVRMDGAFVQSIDTSLTKAMTAASYGVPTGDIAAGIDLKLAIATRGKRINLPGGLPVIVDLHHRRHRRRSGTGEQDRQVNVALPPSRAKTF
jgi:hypothetical protein